MMCKNHLPTKFFLAILLIGSIASVSPILVPITLASVTCEYIPRDNDGMTIGPGYPGYTEDPSSVAREWLVTVDSEEQCNSRCEASLRICGENRPAHCDPRRSICESRSDSTGVCTCCNTERAVSPMVREECDEFCQARPERRGTESFGDVSFTCPPSIEPAATSTGTAAPYTFTATPPRLSIPIPTLPSLTSFMSVEPQGEAGNRYLLIPWIGEYIAAMYKYAIGITGVLAGIMIVIAGLIWLTAGGSAERVSTAKSFIEGALVGLVIALTSYVLLYAVNPELTGFDALKVKFVERVAPETGGGGMEARGEIASGGPGSAQAFRAVSCDGLAESGEEFEAFFTSYYVPTPYGNPSGYNGIASTIAGTSLNDSIKDFFCAVAMECSCPDSEKDTSYKCYAKSGTFAKGGARDGWLPCKAFSEGTNYCGTTDTLSDGQLRHRPGETVAADCNCTSHRSGECKIEVTLRDGTKKTLQITDTGSGIRGRRFDFFTTLGGQHLSGVFKVKFLPGCEPAGEYGVARGSACSFAAPPPGPLGPQPASTTSTAGGEKIAVIGDSITAETPGYQAYLRDHCAGKSLEFFAVRGKQTGWMLEQFRSNVKGKGFKGLIILGGVNDLSSGRTAAQAQSNLDTIYSEAKADGIKVTAITVLPWSGYSSWTSAKQTQTGNLNSWILGSPADIKANTYASFGDASDPTKLKCAYDGHDGTCDGDHLHPNAAGGRALADAIVGAGACR